MVAFIPFNVTHLQEIVTWFTDYWCQYILSYIFFLYFKSK